MNTANKGNNSENPDWVNDYYRWDLTDECDFIAVNKAHEKFTEVTADPKLAALLVMAWATLQTRRGSGL